MKESLDRKDGAIVSIFFAKSLKTFELEMAKTWSIFLNPYL